MQNGPVRKPGGGNQDLWFVSPGHGRSGFEEDPFEKVRGESETLAGLILELTGEIPKKGEIVRFNGFIFKIESVDKRRIKEIHISIIDEGEAN